jgi:hypothetical protein
VLERTAEAFFTLTHVRLYVEDLAGGAHHIDLFSSNSDFVWPVGWHGGNVVVAVGPPAVQNPAPNPYSAFGGYRLIDPGTGAGPGNPGDRLRWGKALPSDGPAESSWQRVQSCRGQGRGSRSREPLGLFQIG